MKVLLLQMDIQWNNPCENIRKAERMIGEKAFDLLVLPEMWATGFITAPQGLADEESSSQALEWMHRTANERQCAVCGSLAIHAADGSYRNRHYFVTPATEYFYDKHHLFTHGHEHEHYTAGSQQIVVQWKGFSFLLLTCYDLRFPVWSRYGIAGHYDAIICVANWPDKRLFAWEVLTKARAIENQCFVLAVNRVGSDPVSNYHGGTTVIDPIGKTLACCKEKTEQPLEVELSLEEVLKRRTHFRVLDDRDVQLSDFVSVT